MSLITTLKRNDHDTKLAREISNLYDVENKRNKFSDVQLNVANKTFHCHKLVLQLYSEYFANSPLSRTGTLQNINPAPFSDVLRFMYTGEVQVTSDSVESLLSTADIIRVSELKDMCLNYLNDSLNGDCVLAYWRLANKYTQSDLADKCCTLVLNDFTKFNSAEKLIEISEDMMVELLRSDNLNVENESTACDILVKWLEVHNDAGEQVHRDRLLLLVRWSGITIDYIKTKLTRNEILMYDRACVKLLQRIVAYLESDCGPFEGLQTFHRPSTRHENSLVTVGTDYDNSNTSGVGLVSLISLQRKDSVRILDSLPIRINNESAICAVNADTLYVVGAGPLPPYKEVWKFDAKSGWISCADMDVGRQGHCVVALDSALYVLGGWDADNKILGIISRYKTKKNAWSSPVGELIHAVDSAACVKYKKKIYLFGGVDENLDALSSVQVYTPGRKSGRLLDKPMPRACAETRAVTWETSAILLCCETCFIYNFDTKIWQERDLYRTNVFGFAAVLDNMTVIIAGGGRLERQGEEDEDDDDDREPVWTCTDAVKSVSVLDIIHNKPVVWNKHASLILPSVIGAHLSVALPVSRQQSDTLATVYDG